VQYLDAAWRPSDYQQLLLEALGDQDPAQVQAQTATTLRALVDEAGDRVRTRPAPTEWSVLECIAHICDAELVIAGRYRWILAHDKPEIMPYEQDWWVDTFHATSDEDPAELLALFEALRTADLALWRRTPAADRLRYGLHRERGPESYELTFRITAGHDIIHTDQARRALAALREAA
jgi:hypothetical protein